jgi:hypothetical protein
MISRCLISLCAAGFRFAFERDTPRAPRIFALAISLTRFLHFNSARNRPGIYASLKGEIDKKEQRRTFSAALRRHPEVEGCVIIMPPYD